MRKKNLATWREWKTKPGMKNKKIVEKLNRKSRKWEKKLNDKLQKEKYDRRLK